MCFQDPVKDLRWQGCECSVWICLNNAEYDRICWHIPEKTEYHRILNVSVQYIAHGNCTNYWAVIETDMYSKYCQTFKIERFAKRTMSECRCKTINFSVLGVGGWGGGGGGFVEVGHFDKHSVKNKRLHRETFWKFLS